MTKYVRHSRFVIDSSFWFRAFIISSRFDKPTDGSNTTLMDAQLNSLKYDSAGLVPIVVQDYKNGEVLMLAWANREALEKTVATGKVHTYSRSRGRLALKGESSGHFQLVKEILTDCDKDAVVIRAEQVVAACHEGYRSCFYRKYEPGASDWKPIAQKAFDPDKVYAAKT